MRQKTIEEYIEIIYVLEKKEGQARNREIASQMGVSPPSVTEMMKKLKDEGYVGYEPYKGAKLTSSGRKLARALMKKHEIIADFLEIIDVKRDLAEIDACQIEHHVSNKTMARLELFVKFVTEAPFSPKWVQHFRHYCKTGERIYCDMFDD